MEEFTSGLERRVDSQVAREAIELWCARNDEARSFIRAREQHDTSWIYFFNAVHDLFGTIAAAETAHRGADFARYLLGLQATRAGEYLPDIGVDAATAALHEVRAAISGEGYQYHAGEVPPERAKAMTAKLCEQVTGEYQGEAGQYQFDIVFWDAVGEAGNEEPEGELAFFITGAQLAVVGLCHAIDDAAFFDAEMKQRLR